MNCSPELCSGNRQREKPGTAFRDTGTRNSVPEYKNPEQRSGIQVKSRTRNSVPGYRAHVWLT